MRVNFGERPFAYLEGHAHRNAADIQEEGDTTEEMVANFGALPFAMGSSDSEGEGSVGAESGKGSVIELAQSGPPTRKLKPPIATIGEHKNTCTLCIHVYVYYDYIFLGGFLSKDSQFVKKSQN